MMNVKESITPRLGIFLEVSVSPLFGPEGPGLEEKHFDRIFKLFQTLASKDEQQSTGVGLTITKEIVELYGGWIWVESEVGRGSTG